jgi:hypothetical protein
MVAAIYTKTEPEPGYVHEVFQTRELLHDTIETSPRANVFRAMRPHGRLSVVTVREHRSSFRGPKRGAVSPIAVLDNLIQPGLITSAGNYNSFKKWYFRWDTGLPRMNGRAYNYPVGPSSLTKQYVPVPLLQRPFWEIRKATDGSYISMGPTLSNRLDIPVAIHPARESAWNRSFGFINELATNDGRKYKSELFVSFEAGDRALGSLLTHWKRGLGTTLSMAIDVEAGAANSKAFYVRHQGNVFPFPSPLSPHSTIREAVEFLPDLDGDDDEYQVQFFQQRPHGQGVRTQASMVPGSWCHGREKNERSAKVELEDGTFLDFAYTCAERDLGLDFNEQRCLILKYLAATGIGFQRIRHFWNSDGSINILQYLRRSDGVVLALAKGGLKGKALPLTAKEIPAELTRSCPNFLLLRTPGHEADDHGRLVDPECGSAEEEKEFDTPSGAPHWVEDRSWPEKQIAERRIVADERIEARIEQIRAATFTLPSGQVLIVDKDYPPVKAYADKLYAQAAMAVIYAMGVGKTED